MIDKAREILNLWVEKVNVLDIDSIEKMYSGDAQLLPTFSSKTLLGQTEIRGYFNKFTTHSSVVVTLHPNSVSVREMSDSVAVVSGLYCWRIDMDGEDLSFEARFTFVITPNSEHPIRHHHSSQIPRSI